MSSIDAKDALESSLEESYAKLRSLIQHVTQQQQQQQQQQSADAAAISHVGHDLQQFAGTSKTNNDEACNALLYAILVVDVAATSTRASLLRHLLLIYGSGGSGGSIGGGGGGGGNEQPLSLLFANMLNIITESYARLLDGPRQQLVWLLGEVYKARVSQVDKLMLQMLRNIQTGSLSDRNVWLAEAMLDILTNDQLNQAPSTSTGIDHSWTVSYLKKHKTKQNCFFY